mgnify:CR=1 FL=1
MNEIVVMFEVTIKESKKDDYLKMAASLKENLEKAEGFIRSERFSSLSAPNKLLSISVWKDEESIAKWRNDTEHRLCQKQGRENYFADYKITVVKPIRTYTMEKRQNAPKDSNEYLGE